MINRAVNTEGAPKPVDREQKHKQQGQDDSGFGDFGSSGFVQPIESQIPAGKLHGSEPAPRMLEGSIKENGNSRGHSEGDLCRFRIVDGQVLSRKMQFEKSGEHAAKIAQSSAEPFF